jgi:hypothetical protein
MLLAPAGVRAQIQCVGVAVQAGVTGQETRQRQPLGAGESRLGDGDHGGRGRCGGHLAPPGSCWDPEGWASDRPKRRRFTTP